MSPAAVLKLAKELRKLTESPLDGIKVLLNEDDVTDVTAELAGPGTRALAAAAHCASLLRAHPSRLPARSNSAMPAYAGASTCAEALR